MPKGSLQIRDHRMVNQAMMGMFGGDSLLEEYFFQEILSLLGMMLIMYCPPWEGDVVVCLLHFQDGMMSLL